jgi:hypothetical protein
VPLITCQSSDDDRRLASQATDHHRQREKA